MIINDEMKFYLSFNGRETPQEGLDPLIVNLTFVFLPNYCLKGCKAVEFGHQFIDFTFSKFA